MNIRTYATLLLVLMFAALPLGGTAKPSPEHESTPYEEVAHYKMVDSQITVPRYHSRLRRGHQTFVIVAGGTVIGVIETGQGGMVVEMNFFRSGELVREAYTRNPSSLQDEEETRGKTAVINKRNHQVIKEGGTVVSVAVKGKRKTVTYTTSYNNGSTEHAVEVYRPPSALPLSVETQSFIGAVRIRHTTLTQVDENGKELEE